MFKNLHNSLRGKNRRRFDFVLVFHHIEGLDPEKSLQGCQYAIQFERGKKKRGHTGFTEIEQNQAGSPDDHKLYFNHKDVSFQTTLRILNLTPLGTTESEGFEHKFKSKSIRLTLLRNTSPKKKGKVVLTLKQNLINFVDSKGGEFVKTMTFPLGRIWKEQPKAKLLMSIKSKMRKTLGSRRDDDFVTETDITSFGHLAEYEEYRISERLKQALDKSDSKVEKRNDNLDDKFAHAELDEVLDLNDLEGLLELGEYDIKQIDLETKKMIEEVHERNDGEKKEKENVNAEMKENPENEEENKKEEEEENYGEKDDSEEKEESEEEKKVEEDEVKEIEKVEKDEDIKEEKKEEEEEEEKEEDEKKEEEEEENKVEEENKDEEESKEDISEKKEESELEKENEELKADEPKEEIENEESKQKEIEVEEETEMNELKDLENSIDLDLEEINEINSEDEENEEENLNEENDGEKENVELEEEREEEKEEEKEEENENVEPEGFELEEEKEDLEEKEEEKEEDDENIEKEKEFDLESKPPLTPYTSEFQSMENQNEDSLNEDYNYTAQVEEVDENTEDDEDVLDSPKQQPKKKKKKPMKRKKKKKTQKKLNYTVSVERKSLTPEGTGTTRSYLKRKKRFSYTRPIMTDSEKKNRDFIRKYEKRGKKAERKGKDYFTYIYYFTNSTEKHSVTEVDRLADFGSSILFVGAGTEKSCYKHIIGKSTCSKSLNERLLKMHLFNLSLYSPNLFGSKNKRESVCVKVLDKKQLRVFVLKLKADSKIESEIKKSSILKSLTSLTDSYWNKIPIKRLNKERLSFVADNKTSLLNVNEGKRFSRLLFKDLVQYGLFLLKVASSKALLGHVEEVELKDVKKKLWKRKKKKQTNTSVKFDFVSNEEEKVYLNYYMRTKQMDQILQINNQKKMQ